MYIQIISILFKYFFIESGGDLIHSDPIPVQLSQKITYFDP